MNDHTHARLICIRNALLPDANYLLGRRVDIVIEQGKIAAVEPPNRLLAEHGNTVDASNFAVIPGLINAHTHAHGTLMKGVAGQWTLEHLLNAASWTGGGRSAGHHRLAAKVAAAEMIAKGCTAAYDMFAEYPVPTRAAIHEAAMGYRDAGFRAIVAPMMADRSFYDLLPELRAALPPELVEAVDRVKFAPHEQSLAVCADLATDWPYAKDGVQFGLAPTIPLHCSDAFIRGCAVLAEQHGLLVQMHVAESRLQATLGRERYGTTLAGHLEKMGLLSDRFTAAHGVWLEPDDHARLARAGASIAHNPGSNLRLGSGIGAMRAWLDAGVNVGIGTDGTTSSDNLNMFEAMRIAAYVSRVRGEPDSRWIDAQTAFDAATVGGARAIGMHGKLGKIEVGYEADLVLLDLKATHYVPRNHLLHQIVYAEDGTGVDSVMIGGRWVYRGRKHLTIDMDALAAEAEAAVQTIRAAIAPLKARADMLEPFVAKFTDGSRARFCAAGCGHQTTMVGAGQPPSAKP